MHVQAPGVRVVESHTTPCRHKDTHVYKSLPYMHTHTWLHTHCAPTPPLPPPFVLSSSLCVQTRRQDVFFFFSLNKNNLLSDVGSLIAVTGPKLKCWLIKASLCVCVCVWVCVLVCVRVFLTLIRPINSLSMTKSALAARQTQLPVKSVLLLLGLPDFCLDVCHSSNQHQDTLRLF